MDKALLPAGFQDLLFPEAGIYLKIIKNLSNFFEKYGYLRVSPPAIEFEDSLLQGPGANLEQQTFRLLDPVSGKMMGVRSDITTQISRIAASRLSEEELPLRLSYFGDVFRVKGEGLHAERQLTQSGIELIGANNATADAEVIAVAVEALQNIGLSGICIDLSIPLLVEILLEDFPNDQKDQLRTAIAKKDIEKISKTKKTEAIISLIENTRDKSFLKKIKLSKDAKKLTNRLIEVIEILESKLDNVNLSIDPIDYTGFKYHTGICFSIFAEGFSGELGRGGHYLAGPKKLDAVGFSLYINELLRALPVKNELKMIFIPAEENPDLSKLWDEGFKVVHGIDKENDNKAKAIKLRCNYLLQNNEVVPI